MSRPEDNRAVGTKQATRATLPRRRVSAVVFLLVAVLAAIAEEQLVRPSALTMTHFYAANLLVGVTGRVALLWSIETFSPTLSLEGTSGDDAPTDLRIVAPSGDVLTTEAFNRLDPSKNVGVCPMHRPSAGTTWWSGRVPETMASDLRTTGSTAYRVEVLQNSSWYAVLLVDSGCRGVGRL